MGFPGGVDTHVVTCRINPGNIFHREEQRVLPIFDGQLADVSGTYYRGGICVLSRGALQSG